MEGDGLHSSDLGLGPLAGSCEHTINNHFPNLTFRGLCIMIYSYNKSQQDALFLKFILIKDSTCFGQICCLSSGNM